MLLEQKTTDFLEQLSSSAPIPGGGGASAAVGAFASALGLMVTNLTVGKKKYADVEEEILEIRVQEIFAGKNVRSRILPPAGGERNTVSEESATGTFFTLRPWERLCPARQRVGREPKQSPAKRVCLGEAGQGSGVRNARKAF